MKVLRRVLIVSLLLLLFVAFPTFAGDGTKIEGADAADTEYVPEDSGTSEVTVEETLLDAPIVSRIYNLSYGKIRINIANGAPKVRCEITYATDKDFSDAKSIVKSSQLGYVTVKDLEPSTQYFFRLRYYTIGKNKQREYGYATSPIKQKTLPPSISFKKEEYEVKFKNTKKLKISGVPADKVELIWSSQDEYIATVDSDGTVHGVHPGRTTITAKIKDTKISAKVPLHVVGTKLVALTFDDGPGAYTPGFLDFLETTPAKVTFFMIGKQVSAYSSTVKRMYKDGHELGNHTFNHPQLTKLQASGMKTEIDKTDEAIYKAAGAYPTVMRPPYGSYNSTLLGLLKVPAVFWSVDTLDWKYRDTSRNVSQILNGATDGAIILMHDIHQTSVEGAKKAIPQLLDKGVELVTVTEMLERTMNKAPEAGYIYFKKDYYK